MPNQKVRWVIALVARIKGKLKFLASHYGRQMLLSLGVVVGVGILSLMVSYVLPRTIQYSFASGQSCAISPIVLPRSLAAYGNATFSFQYSQTLRIAGSTLYAGKLCVVPQHSPNANSTYSTALTLSRLSAIHKKLVVRTAQYSQVSWVALKKPLTLAQSVNFQLSQPDTTFAYIISVDGHRDGCSERAGRLTCPLSHLTLHYGQQYKAELIRTFKAQDVQRVAQMSFQTISATTITSASVADGATVYDKPQQFTFQTDKPLASLGSVTLTIKNGDGTEQVVPTSAAFSGSTITLSVKQQLPRKTTMHLVVSSLRAQDASGLASPYTITFSVSGGPKVTGTTLPNYNAVASPITVNFDQQLDPNQGTSQVSLQADGAAVATSMAIKGGRIVVTPQASYPTCAHLKLTVGQGVSNVYTISGDSMYTYTARAQCHTTFSIGTSVQGRAITAYRIGSGSTQLLFVGTMHGNEQNAGSLLDVWLNELEANVDSIPSGRTIVVIPRINPDGAATNSRVNANSVDLNRNFPASSWQSVITEPDGSSGPYGGSSALSEPESQALASYMQTQLPRITVDYHSHAGVVQGNDAGDADTLALHYALTSGYSEISSSATSSEFDYSTTGSFEDWTNQALGLPEFLVELSSSANNEFSWNRPAMWGLVKGSLP